MSVTKAEIVRIFNESDRLSRFEQALRKLKFKEDGSGCNKHVFIRSKLPWVVKLVFGFDAYPDKKSPLAKHYLWPEKVAGKEWPSGYYELHFQPRADCRNRIKTYNELMLILSQERAVWRTDNHSDNVGRYKGKPVIIDY
jgi:hypothetical protein